MTTSTRPRKFDRAELIEWQTTPDPETGEFPSYDELRLKLLDERGVDVTKAGLRKAAVEYRTEKGLPPAPRSGTRLLPWKLSRACHDDWFGYRCHRWARRALNSEATFTDTELSALKGFERHLKLLGSKTVVAYSTESGWITRQAVRGEEIWYGVMAVKPYPPGRV